MDWFAEMKQHKAITCLKAALMGIPIEMQWDKDHRYKFSFSEDMKIFGPIHLDSKGVERVSTFSDITLANFVRITENMSDEDFLKVVFSCVIEETKG